MACGFLSWQMHSLNVAVSIACNLQNVTIARLVRGFDKRAENYIGVVITTNVSRNRITLDQSLLVSLWCYQNLRLLSRHQAYDLFLSWFIDMLLESAGGERIFEPAGVCVGARVEMKVDIPDEHNVCAFNCHILNKRWPFLEVDTCSESVLSGCRWTVHDNKINCCTVMFNTTVYILKVCHWWYNCHR